MNKFDAVCELLELKTKEDKLGFLSTAFASLSTPSTNSVKTGSKSVATKRGRKPGKRAGRPKKSTTTQEVKV